VQAGKKDFRKSNGGRSETKGNNISKKTLDAKYGECDLEMIEIREL